AQHRVEADHAEIRLLGRARGRIVLVRATQHRLDPRPDLDACRRDLERVAAAQLTRAAHLAHDHVAQQLDAGRGLAELDQTVDHRMLGAKPGRAVDDNRSTVHPVIPLMVCSSWMNFLKSRADGANSSAETKPSSTTNAALR